MTRPSAPCPGDGCETGRVWMTPDHWFPCTVCGGPGLRLVTDEKKLGGNGDPGTYETTTTPIRPPRGDGRWTLQVLSPRCTTAGDHGPHGESGPDDSWWCPGTDSGVGFLPLRAGRPVDPVEVVRLIAGTCGKLPASPSCSSPLPADTNAQTVHTPVPSCSDGSRAADLVLPCGCVPPCEGHHEDES